MSSRRTRRTVTASVVGVAVVVVAGHGLARSQGLDADNCAGCHSGGRAPTVELSAMPSVVMPGATVTLRVSIAATSGPRGGFHLWSNGPGAFQLIAGQGTRLVSPDSVVHSTPGTASDGRVTFDVRWVAPATAGGVDLRVAAVSANGDGASRGDGYGEAQLNLVFGCSGATYYRDLDGDGYGSMASGVTRACALPAGYATRNDDCDDSDERVHPDAPERCNNRDEDCDGAADDGLSTMTFYPDMDGDGFGGRVGTPVMGCGMTGYGVGNGDCDDRDPAINPAAAEVCDARDNNCNNRVDERVRPNCGVGLCARASATCDARDCVPGTPGRERCNGLDDDCDGVVDQGDALCPADEACVAGRCAPSDGGAPGGDAAAAGDAGARDDDAGAGGDNDGDGDGDGDAGADGGRRGRVPGCSVASARGPAARGLAPALAATLWLASWAVAGRRRRPRGA